MAGEKGRGPAAADPRRASFPLSGRGGGSGDVPATPAIGSAIKR